MKNEPVKRQRENSKRLGRTDLPLPTGCFPASLHMGAILAGLDIIVPSAAASRPAFRMQEEATGLCALVPGGLTLRLRASQTPSVSLTKISEDEVSLCSKPTAPPASLTSCAPACSMKLPHQSFFPLLSLPLSHSTHTVLLKLRTSKTPLNDRVLHLLSKSPTSLSSSIYVLQLPRNHSGLHPLLTGLQSSSRMFLGLTDLTSNISS